MARLQVALVSPERELWAGEADVVDARTLDGDIGILPGHAPIVGVLVDGSVVRIKATDSPDLAFAVHGGFLSVADDQVSILPTHAELGSEIDVAATRALLQATGEADAIAERRAKARLEAAGHDA